MIDPVSRDQADFATQTADEEGSIEKYRADAARFERLNPDFRAAYNFFMTARAAELKAIGYDTPQSLHQALIAEEMVIVQMAFQGERSPAEVIHRLAHQRGFQAAERPGSRSGRRPFLVFKEHQRSARARPRYSVN